MTKLLVIDTETGGIDPDRESLLAIAAVIWADGAIEAEIEILVRENPLVVTAEAMAINRIDLTAHAAAALPPAEALRVLRSFLGAHGLIAGGLDKVVLAGHNIGFDVGFLKRLCRLAGEPFDAMFSHRSLDTASILRFLGLCNLLPTEVSGSSEAFAHFGIEPAAEARHTALGDARATALLLTRLVDLPRSRSAGLTSQAAA